MKSWLKILIAVTASIAVVLVAGIIMSYRLLTKSLPEYEGEIEASQVYANIKIYRDSCAIPYIIASNDKDAAFALGYAHAQERMFQMDLFRRAALGRLSEVFGRETVPYDVMFRTVNMQEAADEVLRRIDPEQLKFLQAYSAGINFYLERNKNNLPIEFSVLGYEPERWKPEHSLLLAKMLAWELNISWWCDVTFSNLIQQIGEEKVKEIIPDFPENAPTIIPKSLASLPKVSQNFVDVNKDFRKFMKIAGTHIGSNNWVVAPQKSASGRPIIANDPHLTFQAPAKWYAVSIFGGTWNAAGVTIPGVPAVVIGKNNRIAWTMTNIMLDDADFYVEKLDSLGDNYMLDGQWRPLNLRKETIKVKDSTDIYITVKSTHRGPIVSDIHPYRFLYEKGKEPAATLSMRWTGNDYSEEFASFYKLNRAGNWSEFKESLRGFYAPGQNFVYADVDNNIGYQFAGRLPLRQNQSAAFVYDGTLSTNDWKGYASYDELPSLFNPAQNYIATANNKTDASFKYYISNLWEPPSRIERITELLNSKEKHSVRDFKNYQNDQVSTYAREIIPYILKAFEGRETKSINVRLSLELFRKWDFDLNKNSQVPAIYEAFFNRLLKNIYEDELGYESYKEFIFLASVPYRTTLKLLKENKSSWFDNTRTPEVENRDAIIIRSLYDAVKELERTQGLELYKWQWGRIHTTTFKHFFSGKYDFIDKFINVGPVEIGGDGVTVFNTEYSFTDPYDNILGPSMRFIYDFSQPDWFYLVLTTGQSGNFVSGHYKDMTDFWVHGGYFRVGVNKNKVENSGMPALLIKKTTQE